MPGQLGELRLRKLFVIAQGIESGDQAFVVGHNSPAFRVVIP
jgi:hypothetical protein